MAKITLKPNLLAKLNFNAVVLILLVSAAILPFNVLGQAPNISYGGPYTYVAGASVAITPTNSGGAVTTPGSYGNPVMLTSTSNQALLGIAIDSKGNIYYGTDNGTSINIEEIAGGNGNSPVLFSSFGDADWFALMCDPANNLYADLSVEVASSSSVFKFNAGSQSSILISSAFTDPRGMASDAAGDIYVADFNAGIKKIAKGSTTPVIFNSTLANPTAVAVDASGNVYAVAQSVGYVTEYKTNGSVVTIGSGLSEPQGIAVDAAGDIFVADTQNESIKEYPVGGSAFIAIGNTVAKPTQLTLDPSGYIYFIDQGDGTTSQTVDFMQRFNGYTISPALPQGLVLNAATGQITGTPTQTMAATIYTVTASNSWGTSSAGLAITVNPALPAFGYTTPNQFFKGDAITPLAPTSGNGVAPFGYSTSASYTTSYTSGFTNPNALAADISGDVYVADYGANTVALVTSPGGSPTIVASGFKGPTGIALDAAGNIYVADSGNGAVKEISADDGTTVTIASGFSEPYGVVVDKVGNVYVSDAVKNTITKIPAGGGTHVTVGTGFKTPEGLAMDAAGNLYVADYGNNAVKEISAASGTISLIGSGFNGPSGVASDAAGNLYVADYKNQQVKYVAIGSAPVVIGTGFNNPAGVALNGTGLVFVADYHQTSIFQVTPTGGFFVGPNLPAGLSFDNNTGIISGTPTATQADTYYAVTGYNVSGGATAGINIDVAIGPNVSYPSPKTYALDSQISPLVPASTNVAPQAYSSTTGFISTVGKFITDPNYLSFDVAGNLYVTYGAFTFLTEIYASGAPSTKISMGFSNPTAVFVDPKSFIYLCDSTDNAIVRIGPNGGPFLRLYTGLNNPEGIITDVNGNIYESDCGSNTVNKFPAAGGTPVAYGTGFNHPRGLAFDAAGNLYVVDSGNNALKEVLASTGATVTLVTGLSSPSSVAVDATGNIFISDNGNNVIKELPSGSTAPIAIGSSVGSPLGLVVDQAGNVDFGSFSNKRLYQITPTGGYYLNTPLSAGLKLSNATGTVSGTPTVVSPATNYTVTAYGNGYGVPFNVNIAVVQPGNAQLASLVINAGTLTPSFKSTTTNYTVSVPYAQSSIKLTPTEVAAGSTITINGTAVISGTTSGFLILNAGANTINVVVTAHNGVTTDTYTLTVTRATGALSNDALLTSIKLTPAATLTVVKGTSYVNYTTTVAASTSSITVTAAEQDPTATLKINGVTTTPGAASASIPLTAGTNVINIVSTAQDGVTTKTYTITATRPASLSTDALLTSIKLSPASTLTVVTGPSYVNYTTTVAATTNSVTVTATEQDGTATIKVNGVITASGTASAPIILTTGSNTITIVSTAQDGVTTKTYTITATKSANASLSALKISSGTLTPTFSVTTTSYTASVTNATTSITETPTAGDATGTIKVNGTAVTSGTASAAIQLSVGPNTITTVVTDGAATKTYTITVTRTASTDALLTSIKLTPASALTIVTGPGYVNYTTSVPNTTSSITVTAAVQDATATIKVNGITSASGAASAPIALAVGSNVITTVVTAQDGVTTKTYIITATRAMPGANSFYEPVSVIKPADDVSMENDVVKVHQAVSPNGDGINDYLTIDNITNYPDNELMIVDRNGIQVYHAKGYDNSSKIFDGHSNINGKMQMPGTYFYSLDYTVNGQNKHKTGFIMLKY